MTSRNVDAIKKEENKCKRYAIIIKEHKDKIKKAKKNANDNVMIDYSNEIDNLTLEVDKLKAEVDELEQ